MKKTFVLASHGKMSAGLLDSIEMIMGKQENIRTLCAYEADDYNIETAIKELLSSVEGDEIIVLTDVLGGSVHNEFIKVKHQFDFFLISGMNFPLVIELLINQDKSDTRTYIKEALESSKKTIALFEEEDSLTLDVFDF